MALGDIAVSVTVRIDGTPPIVSEAAVRVACGTADGGDGRGGGRPGARRLDRARLGPPGLSGGDRPRLTVTAAASAITNRRVLAIAVPIVLSNATIPILGAVDTAVIGQLGQAAPIGAVGLGAVILTTIYWVFGFLRMGTTGMVAQARGAGESAETGALLMRGLMIAAAAGPRLRRRAGGGLLGGLPHRAGLGRGRGAGAGLSLDPHLGRPGDDRDLRAHRLADRDGADARRARRSSSR